MARGRKKKESAPSPEQAPKPHWTEAPPRKPATRDGSWPRPERK